MQYIELSGNQIEKLEPLAGLTSLTSLYLGSNQIKDIGPLAALTKLWSLSRRPRTRSRTSRSLAKLTRLSTLDLGDNQVEDVGPLTKQTELKLLILERNKIKDLKPLVDAAKADAAGPEAASPRILRLYIDGNPLSDDAKTKQLAALKEAGVRIEG